MILMIFCAILIGLSLGLLGSGGAILTVPALIYGVGLNEKEAIATALLIVAWISLLSSLSNIRTKKIVWANIAGFLLPSLFSSYLGALAGSYVEGYIQLTVFSLIMLISGINTLVKKELSTPASVKLYKIVLIGFLIGFMTGFVGVGGGFLIVPALILLLNLSMRQAVATSLILISANSLIAFLRYAITFNREAIEFNWSVIIVFVLIGTLGSYVGQSLASRFKPGRLQKGFAYLLILLAILTFYRAVTQL